MAGPSADTLVLAGATGAFRRDELLGHIAAARDAHDAVVQAFDPPAVYGRRHLIAAVEKAVRSHAQDRAIARDLATEIVCYVAGTQQIDRALELAGLPTAGEHVVVAALGEGAEAAVGDLFDRAGLTRDDDVVQERPETLDRLGIPETSRQTVPEHKHWMLVVERVALVDVDR